MTLHVLFLPSWYPAPGDPVPGIFVRDQALALREVGERIGVLPVPRIHVRSRDACRSVLPHRHFELEDDAGTPVLRTRYRFPFAERRGPLRARALLAAGRAAFSGYMRRFGAPHLLHAHSLFDAGLLASHLGRRYSVPFLLTEHATRFLAPPSGSRRARRARSLLSQYPLVIAVSPALRDGLRQYGFAGRIEVIGECVEDSFFHSPGPPPSPPPFHFATVALLVPRKGLDLLLRAFSLAFPEDPCYLHVAGEGEERAPLERLAATLGIRSRVFFLGSLDRVRVRDLLRRCHAFVSASRKETFGLALAEALACSKPVIATDCGGPTYFVDESNGIVVPPGDVGALADALGTMVRTYDRYDPSTIRERCVSRFGRASFARSMVAIHVRLLDEAGSLRSRERADAPT